MLELAPAKELVLRPYQLSAVESLRQCVREGKKRPILVAPTGAGKTAIASHLLKQADQKGSYALFLVDRVALVDQTSAVLDNYGIRHGVVQGIHDRYAPRENVQVCSIQTLAKRLLPRNPSLIIWDEVHVQHKAMQEYINRYTDAVAVGLTATPFTKGLGNNWNAAVNVCTARELMNDGFLVEPAIYVGKSPDDDELELNSDGEFSDKGAEVAGIRIVGDVVQEWVKKTFEHFGRPVKTIVFSPTVTHGEALCQSFKEAGYNFQQISYLDRNDSDRREKIEEFRRPDSMIQGLVSCGVLTRGFDVPDCLVGISCKPYRKSLSSHMQEIGRIMRSHPGKDKALWLCHAGNIQRFATEMFDVWNNGAGDLDTSTKLDSKARERDPQVREKIVCPECTGALRANICISCGYERPVRSDIVAVEGELREFKLDKVSMKPRDGLRAPILSEPKVVYQAALHYCAMSTSKGEDFARRWAFGMCFGKDGIYPGAKPPWSWNNLPIPASVNQHALSLVQRETKRFRKNNSKRKAA